MADTLILIAGRHPLLRDGGLPSYVRAWGRAAIRAGYEPQIFCAAAKSASEATPFGIIHSVRSRFRPFRTIALPLHARAIAGAIERFAMRRGGRFLVHSFGSWGGVGAAAARRLERRGLRCATAVTPFTTCRHETLGKIAGAAACGGLLSKVRLRLELAWARLAVSHSEGRGLRLADRVFVNYASVRRIVSGEFGAGLPFAKIAYAPETAFLRDAAWPCPAPDALAALAPSGAPLIIAVSRHDERKGIDVLLQALALLHRRGTRFRACVAGTGALLKRHRRLAAELGLPESVILPGRIPDAFDFLAHADIFVLPSIEEGSGSVALLEAMQAGAAPVVSDVDGLPEDVTHGESALLVPAGDSAALARALDALVADAELRARIARGAQARFRDRFSADAFAADVARAYAGLGFPPTVRQQAKAVTA